MSEGVLRQSPKRPPDPTISVIIPTYNRHGWVAHAISSVIAQTYAPEEIIVVDDGSTDGTEAIVARYSGVKYIRQQQAGPASARNTGAAAARGDWLTFLDSDDRWLPNKLHRQVDFLRNNPQYHAVYTDEIWIRNGRRVNQGKRHRKRGGWLYLDCLPLCIISPSSIMLSRSAWSRAGGFDPALPACEDYDLWLRLAARFPIGFVAEPLIVKYGGHDDQLSRQWGLDRYRVIALEKMLCATPLRSDWHEQTRAEVIRRCEILATGFGNNGSRSERDNYLQKAAYWRNWRGQISAAVSHHQHGG